ESSARSAVRLLREGGEQTLLAEALTTHGKALARIQQHPRARATLDQAISVAQTAGHLEGGGIAAVTAIEELSDDLAINDLQEYYRTAEELLARSQNRSLNTRLGECARRVLAAEFAGREAEGSHASSSALPSMPTDFSLDTEVLRYEGNLIRKALEDS